MANLKEVRIRIASVNSTQQITKAMKMVSAAKLKRATDAIVQMRPYAEKLRDILGNLTANLEESNSVFAQEREVKNVLVVAITSNRGLCGGFNSSVIKATNRMITEQFANHRDNGTLHILCVGKKAQEFYSRQGYKVVGNNNELFNNLNFNSSTKIAELVMEGYASKQWDKVVLVYNQFKNAATQLITEEAFLPLPKPTTTSTKKIDYILEPSQEEIVEQLIPNSLKTTFFKALLDSHASEHGARMTAMDKASENANELLKSLKISYNRARQAAITTELTEIVSGAAALQG